MMLRILFAILGLRGSRIREYQAVLRDARRQGVRPPTFWDKLSFVGAIIAGRSSPKQLWRARLGACHRCPLYDRAHHRCGQPEPSTTGCRCYMPLKAAVPQAGCWLDQMYQEEGLKPHKRTGWVRRNLGPQ